MEYTGLIVDAWKLNLRPAHSQILNQKESWLTANRFDQGILSDGAVGYAKDAATARIKSPQNLM
jgi:hypothetical protein